MVAWGKRIGECHVILDKRHSLRTPPISSMQVMTRRIYPHLCQSLVKQARFFPLNQPLSFRRITFRQCREYHFKFSIRFIYVHVLLVERELRRWLVHIWTRVRLGQKVMQNLVAVVSSDWLCPAESQWRALSRLLWSFEPIGVHLN